MWHSSGNESSNLMGDYECIKIDNKLKILQIENWL